MKEKRRQSGMSEGVLFSLCGSLECPPGWRGTEHSHPFFEILFVTEGELEFHGETTTGTLLPGKIAMILPEENHWTRNPLKKKARVIYCGFSLGGENSNFQGQTIIRGIPHADFISASNSLERCIQYKSEGVFAPLELMRIVHPALCLLENEFQSKQFKMSGIIPEACRYLENNTGKPVSVKNLASKFYRSPNYFGELFKEHTGMTVKQFHNSTRMRFALELLTRDGFSVDTVSRELGFSSSEYFSRSFKGYFGFSPKKSPKVLRSK